MPSPILTPADGRHDVCPDTPLIIEAADLEPARRIRLRSRDGADLIELRPDDQGEAWRTIGGARDDRGLLHRFSYRAVTPMAVRDGHAGGFEIRPPRTLRPATDYCVEVDGLDRPWSFRTRDPLPSATRVLWVAADGSGDFCTVQAAIDAAPSPVAEPVVIEVAAGCYREICFIAEDRPPMIIRGAGRGRTVLSYDNNNRRNGHPSASRCRNRMLGDRDLYNGWRANVGVDAADIRFEDLTLINTTPAGGSQAEAFRGNQRRLVLNRVELLGHQDTLRMQGQAFVSHCLIAGTVDFVWGCGAVVHWHNEFRSRGPGYVFQIRNDAGQRGHLALSCRFTAEQDVDDQSVYVARTDTTAFPDSEVTLIDCRLGRHLHPDAGLVLPDRECPTVQFAESGSIGPDGPPSAQLPTSTFRRLTPAQAARDADPATFLDGWVPYTVNAQTERVLAGRTVPVDWSAPPDHDHRDRITLAGRAVQVDSRSPLGRVAITAPSRPGAYQVEYRPVDRPQTTAIARLEVIDG